MTMLTIVLSDIVGLEPVPAPELGLEHIAAVVARSTAAAATARMSSGQMRHRP